MGKNPPRERESPGELCSKGLHTVAAYPLVRALKRRYRNAQALPDKLPRSYSITMSNHTERFEQHEAQNRLPGI